LFPSFKSTVRSFHSLIFQPASVKKSFVFQITDFDFIMMLCIRDLANPLFS